MRRVLLFVWFCIGLVLPAQANDAGTLRARHAELRQHLAAGPFGRPLHVDSSADGGLNKGEIHAVIGQPFSVVAAALSRATPWCDILTLQLTIKRCTASDEALTAFITRKPRDSADSAHRIDFGYQLAAAGPDYLHVVLYAASGPIGTRDYEIRLEATPLDRGRTFIHLSYTYTLGVMARLALDAYLMGSGRDKFGFTVVEHLPDGSPVYVDGVRGVIERSAMRHYLAVDAYLWSLGTPPGQRLETRLRRWYSAISQYPQLHEVVGPDEYVEMKRREAAAG